MLTALPRHPLLSAVTSAAVVLVALLLFASPASAATLSGVMHSDETWDTAHSPYVLTGELEIAAGVHLTIQPGVKVQVSPSFSGEGMFHVFGTLSAQGTALQPVVINGGGKDLLDRGSTTTSGVATVSHARITNVKSLFGTIGPGGGYGHLDLYDSFVIGASSYSYIWYPGSDVHIERNVFRDSAGFSVGVSGGVKVHILNNAFVGEVQGTSCEASLICNWADYGSSSLEVHGNDFSAISGTILSLPIGYDPAGMNATSNYWGSRTPSQVDDAVLDANDTSSRASVIPLAPLLLARPFDTPAVDLTPPSSPLVVSAPTGFTKQTSASISFNGAEPGGSFLCSLDQSSFDDCSSPITLTALTDGAHALRIKQQDDWGNVSAATTASWTVDTQAPAPPSPVSTPGARTNLTSGSIQFAGESGASFDCALDGAGFAPCTSPVLFSGLGEGPHSMSLRQTDAAGNTGAAGSVSWVIDLTAPSAATITLGPPAVSTSRTARFTLTGEAGASFECALDGGPYAACGNPAELTGLSDGEHTVAIRQVDIAGNPGPGVTSTWSVDATPPDTPTITDRPSSSTAEQSATVAFTAPAGATVTCAVDGGNYRPCSSPLRLTDLTAGHHSVAIRAADELGNQSLPALAEWSIDLPIGVSINDGDLFTNDPNVHVAVVWPADVTTVTIANDGGFRKAQTFPVRASVAWKLAESGLERLPKTIYVRYGNSTKTFQDDIILDQTPPVLTSVVAAPATRAIVTTSKARKARLTLRASDKTSGVKSIQVTPSKAKTGTRVKYAKRVTVAVSTKTLYVRVQDRAGNNSKWRKVSVR